MRYGVGVLRCLRCASIPAARGRNRRNAAAVVIEGSNEREAGELQVKDLVAGAEAAKNIADNAEWKAERPGQFTVKDAELVEKLLTIPAVAQWVGKNGK